MIGLSQGKTDISVPLFLRHSDRLRQLFPSEPSNRIVKSEPRGDKDAFCAALLTLARGHGFSYETESAWAGHHHRHVFEAAKF